MQNSVSELGGVQLGPVSHNSCGVVLLALLQGYIQCTVTIFSVQSHKQGSLCLIFMDMILYLWSQTNRAVA